MCHKGEVIDAMKVNNVELDQLKEVRKGFDLSTEHFHTIGSSGLCLP